MDTNLDHLIHDAKFKDGSLSLNVEQRADILRITGKRCRFETRERLAERLKLPLKYWERFGIYSRVVLNDTGAHYICGQSWNEEMRTLRDCILGKI